MVFDFDLQHYKQLSTDNLGIAAGTIREMLRHFNDETDGTIGKLYINYPMIEAYRDCTSFFDEEFLNRFVDLEDLTRYKEIVGKRGIKKNLSAWKYDDFLNLIDMNLRKVNFIITKRRERPHYSEYMDDMDQMSIFNSETLLVFEERSISVLCSLYLIIVDYMGKSLWRRFG